jgi:hypothetical protein
LTNIRRRTGTITALMRVLYNILFNVFFILASPYYFIRMQRRGNWHRGFAQRFRRSI